MKSLPCILFILLLITCHSPQQLTRTDGQDPLRYPGEKHLKNITQLTFGGNNAEAYWSFDNRQLTFQSDFSKWSNGCDQIFRIEPGKSDLSQHNPVRISTGTGRTTCSYFMPGNKKILFASTHEAGKDCPPAPERSATGKYVWAVYESFDIYVADLQGTILQKLTNTPGYDAEATVSPRGDLIVFTSLRDGDLDLYTMKLDGSDVKRVTHELGYDGGAFFSPDGKKLVFRASRPKSEQAKKEYLDLLHQGLVQPVEMEIFVCNIDGSDLRQVTQLGKANWAPFYLPDNKRIIFSSNHAASRGFSFNLFMIQEDGTGLEKISHDQTFDSFPMFSPNGKYLVFASNRFNGGTRDTNLFLAEWVN
jgi:TolB protein